MSETPTPLQPCPYCGSEPSTSTYYIECESCDVAPKIDWFHAPKEHAIAAWNRRAAHPPVQGAGEPVDGLPTTLRFYTRHKYFESMDAAPLGGENWIEVDVVPKSSLSPNTKEPT